MKLLLSLLIIVFSSNMIVAQGDARPVIVQQPVHLPAVSSTNNTPGIISIPVVVHVLYNTNQQNISDEQIKSQLVALNKDYQGKNSDKSKVPSYFADLVASAGFEFHLAQVDPKGFTTTGIIRKSTSIQMFGVDDRIKTSRLGGDDAWNRDKYLNIWIGNIAGGVMGFASKIGCAAETDGVVISYNAFGTMGTVAAPFNLGRTATHEIGHWLNLRHIWGDEYCGSDDVDDTPTQRSSNRGNPTGEKFSCGTTAHGDMYMNFMDLTDDASMFMFTTGQRNRMRALFAPGGARQYMVSSNVQYAGSIQTLTIRPEPVIVVTTSVYPNPATASINIEVKNGVNWVNKPLSIYNVMGQAVITTTMTSSRFTINISNLQAGVYFIREASENKMIKFVKN
ncbi:MAG TPA: M43 family zinc metalloprotease [Chitinophagaceae bacterium]|nr:M43 family zinc metalloprotease [Chitinophagaceae bacterium]